MSANIILVIKQFKCQQLKQRHATSVGRAYILMLKKKKKETLWSYWHRHITNNLVEKHFNRERKPNFDEVHHCQGLFQRNCWPSRVYVISEVLVITLQWDESYTVFSFTAIMRELYIFCFSHDIFIFSMTSFIYFFYWYNLQVIFYKKQTKGMEKEKPKKKKKKSPGDTAALHLWEVCTKKTNFCLHLDCGCLAIFPPFYFHWSRTIPLFL